MCPPDVPGAPPERPARVLLGRDRSAWREILRGVRQDVRADDVLLAGAGVAFFSFLSVVPALIALVSVYGLVADPDDIERQLVEPLAAAPAEVRELVGQQLRAVAEGQGRGLGTTAVLGVLATLWSASTGINYLVRAVNRAYGLEETRGFLRVRALALAFTVGAVALAAFALGVVNLLPGLLSDVGLGPVGRGTVTVVRWPLLGGAVLLALTLLYRYAPDRRAPRWGWTAPGTVAAVLAWLVTSGGFSLYTSRLGTFNETYGSLGTVVVLLLWLLLSAVAVIVGAEINAQSERHGRRREGRARRAQR